MGGGEVSWFGLFVWSLVSFFFVRRLRSARCFGMIRPVGGEDGGGGGGCIRGLYGKKHTYPSRTPAHTYTQTSAPPSTPAHTYRSSPSSPPSASPDPPSVRSSSPHSARSLPKSSYTPSCTSVPDRPAWAGNPGGGTSRARPASWDRRWGRSTRLDMLDLWLGLVSRRCRSSKGRFG